VRRLRQVKGWTGGQVEAGFYGNTAVVYYDAAGNQLDTWELAKLYQNSDGNFSSGGGSTGEIWPDDAFQVIVLILGIIMTRYFLCSEKKKVRPLTENRPEAYVPPSQG